MVHKVIVLGILGKSKLIIFLDNLHELPSFITCVPQNLDLPLPFLSLPVISYLLISPELSSFFIPGIVGINQVIVGHELFTSIDKLY